jgi:hypothetical protein
MGLDTSEASRLLHLFISTPVPVCIRRISAQVRSFLEGFAPLIGSLPASLVRTCGESLLSENQTKQILAFDLLIFGSVPKIAETTSSDSLRIIHNMNNGLFGGHNVPLRSSIGLIPESRNGPFLILVGTEIRSPEKLDLGDKHLE